MGLQGLLFQINPGFRRSSGRIIIQYPPRASRKLLNFLRFSLKR
jgi:hypothetical protein